MGRNAFHTHVILFFLIELSILAVVVSVWCSDSYQRRARSDALLRQLCAYWGYRNGVLHGIGLAYSGEGG